MLRAGLLLYDLLAGRSAWPRARAIRLPVHPAGAALDPAMTHGFEYSDGWVDDAQVHAIAHMLSMPVADVEGVATFFNRIYRMPVGRHVILICDSIACYLNGYEALADAFKRELGIEYGIFLDLIT